MVENFLNEMRNSLFANGKYTDTVSENFLKFIDAKQRKFKVIFKEQCTWKNIFVPIRRTVATPYKAIIAYPISHTNYKKDAEIGIYKKRYLRYIKRHQNALYLNLLTTGKRNSYLTNIDKQAEKLLFQLIKQLAEHALITEQRKVDKQIEWLSG